MKSALLLLVLSLPLSASAEGWSDVKGKNGQGEEAGATYKIVPNPKADDCSYESTFVCITGCNKKETPKELTKSWWECGGP